MRLNFTAIVLILLLSMSLIGITNTSAQNLILNGNFNSTTANWVTNCTSVEAIYYETTYGGTVGTNHVAEVDDESCFHQDVCVLPGASYTFSMDASRRTTGSPNPLTTHINISGLDILGAVVGTYVNMDFTRTNTVFSLTPVTGIPVVTIPSGSGVVRLRITITDNTTGYSTLGMIVDNFSLVFNPYPAITGAATACPGVAEVLSVNGVGSTGITYNWTLGVGSSPATSTAVNPSVSWSTPGTATVRAVLGNGVCFVDTAYFNVSIGTTAATTINDTTCSDVPVVFNGTPLSTTGTYSETLTTISGCDSVVTLNLYVKPQPSAPVITGDTFYCQGEPFTPFSVTGTGVLWYTAATGGVGSVVPPTVPTGTPGTYIYYASQVVLGCESGRDSIRVVVNPTPSAPIPNDVTYCQFAPTVPLTATGTNLLWYTTATGGVGNPVAPTPSSTVAGVFTYYVSQVNNTCESPRAPLLVTINAKPPAPIITNTPGSYCPGQPFNNWTIVSGSGILWYAGPTGGVGTATPPVVNTSVPGTYTFWASQTVLGCESDRSSVTVTVFSAVSAGFNYLIHWGCHGDTVDFTNNSTGAVNYQWDFGDGSSSILPAPSHVYPVQGLYIVKLYAHSFTCVDSNIQTIDLRHKDSSAFSITSPLLCQGQSTAFTNNSVATTPSYLWNFGDGTTSVSLSPTHTYLHTGTYLVSLIVSDFVPCYDTATQIVTVDSAGSLNMSLSDTTLCLGTYITMSADFLSAGSTALVWNLGNGDSITTGVNPVLYAYPNIGTFTITSSVRYRACPAINSSRTVNVFLQPKINLGSDTTICPGGAPLILTDVLTGTLPGATWLWSTGAASSSIAVSEPGIYFATVRLGNCFASDTITLTNDCYINIPNAFSPNSDGINDFFNPRDYFTNGLKTFNMTIYNRWGQVVFETSKTSGSGWDGKFNNELQPQGVFIYRISATFIDGQAVDKTGNITLIR